MKTNRSPALRVPPHARRLALLSSLCLLLPASPAPAANREVKPETFNISVTPADGQSHIFLFYSANNANGTSNYITFTPLANASAATPSTYSVTLQVPVSNVFSEQVALISIYTVAGRAPNILPLLAVTTGLSNAAAVLATNQAFESVFPGGAFAESQIQSALLSSDSAILSTFVQDNLGNFSSLSTGLDGLQSASMNLMDFSNGRPSGIASVSVVPEPGSALLFLLGTLTAGGLFARERFLKGQRAQARLS